MGCSRERDLHDRGDGLESAATETETAHTLAKTEEDRLEHTGAPWSRHKTLHLEGQGIASTEGRMAT